MQQRLCTLACRPLDPADVEVFKGVMEDLHGSFKARTLAARAPLHTSRQRQSAAVLPAQHCIPGFAFQQMHQRVL
jgi:hypothetical protein